MRILFVVPYPPSLIRVRPYQLIRQLSRGGHHVTVATLWTTEQERQDVEELENDCERVVAVHLPRARSLWNCLRALPTKKPLQAAYCLHPKLLQHIDALRPQTDIVHVEHLRGALYGLHAADSFKSNGQRKAVIWDSVDCISHLFEQAV
ncbi:MAG: glycosyltransferase, partial [Chloroflexota bacterium]|nr:glycosyltransferase [Chloroflexota bacterium]